MIILNSISDHKDPDKVKVHKIKVKAFAGILFTVLLSVLISFAQPQTNNDGFIHHSVKKGESISLLCIQYYGYYSSTLCKAIQKDNPSLKNVDMITVGQQLLFKKPSERKTETAYSGKAATEIKDTVVRTDTVFVKQLDLCQGVVTYIEGSSLLRKSGANKSIPLTINTVVFPGDRIETTSNGRVEILVNRESVVRMKENSILELDSLRDIAKSKGKTRFNFSLGSVWTKVKKFKDSISRFELELPTAVAGVHGTVYQTSVQKDSSADVNVFEGEVAVSSSIQQSITDAGNLGPNEVAGPHEIAGPHEVSLEAWTRIVRSMQKVHISKKGIADSTTAIKEIPRDNWTLWNQERDRRIAEVFSEE